MIQAKPEQVEPLQAKLAAPRAFTEFVDLPQGQRLQVHGATRRCARPSSCRSASLDQFAQDEGRADACSTLRPTGAQVLVLVGSRSQPVDEAQATPAIEQFL